MNTTVHDPFPPLGGSGSMVPNYQTPGVGILICGLCSREVLPKNAPSEKTLARFCKRIGRLEVGQTACSWCIKKYGAGAKYVNRETPLTHAATAARTAIAGNKYEDYVTADGQIGQKFSEVEAEIEKHLRHIERLALVRNEIIRVRDELDVALRKSPNASYFLRRVEANRTISRREVRQAVFARDRHACVKCGRKYLLSVDHIIPVIAGGGDELGNLQTLCCVCNSAKGGRVAA